MRTIGVVTVGRSDYGIYLSLLKQMKKEPTVKFAIYATGTQLVPEFGMTIREIKKDGFAVSEQVQTQPSGDTPSAMSKSMGLTLAGFSQIYKRRRPDLLLTLGDRYEMHAAV